MCEVIQKEKLPTIASATVVRALLEHSDLREGNKAFARSAHHGMMVMVKPDERFGFSRARILLLHG